MVAAALAVSGVVVVAGGQTPVSAQAVRPVQPQRINLTQMDLEFILAQIQISEAHPEGTGTLCTAPDALTNALACVNSILNVTLPFGLRNTDGRNNNIVDGRNTWGSAGVTFPRLTSPVWKSADGLMFDPDGPSGPLQVGDPTSYEQSTGIVVDADPRKISNLISDQTEMNPAAAAAATETQGHGFGASTILVDQDRNPDTPKIIQYVLPNVAPDAGFSASYNSLFTLFGQFFDHGLDLAQKGGSGTVFVPLAEDDPLYVPGSPNNFMVLTRATNQPGPDGVLGDDPATPGIDESLDDVKDATNQVTPYIDNNQTYTSNPAHQVFIREYALNEFGKPVSTGRLLSGADGGLATWAEVKAQAENLLGIHLEDGDVTNVPMIATDAYGRFLPGVDGYPQLVLTDGTTMEGNPLAPVSPSAVGAVRTGIAFLNDIAHHAVPGTWDDDHNPGTPAVAQTPDTDPGTADDQLPGTYDDEMLGAHYICGDGRCNENIGLTAMHDIFHSEHNGLVQQLEEFIPTIPAGSPAALPAWRLPNGQWNGERIFQAAKFINEMEYQHIVFGEFARAIQPNVNLFDAYDPTANPAITAEFAHAVYRFGHSMLTETMARTNADGSTNDMSLMDAFLNPPAYTNGGSAGPLTHEEASGAIVRGMVNQRGEEIDEFITEALRNNLVGLPLDLGTLNITRARSEGIAPLNQVRRELFNGTLVGAGGNAALKPYHDWEDFGLALRHTGSLVNFIAAYGTHPTILAAADNAARRQAAQDLVDGVTPDAADFMAGTGAWANDPNGLSITGLEDVDLWIGGLAEAPPLFGGMLGSTFNFVFEHQMEALQDNDRLYYLARTAGMPLLAELEGNTFSDLIRRNTDAVNVPVMAFTRPDYTFDLSAQTNPKGIVDDKATPYNEPNLDGISKLVRTADGTIRLTGKGTTENHSAWLGTNGDDKVRSAEGDDSLWGNDGNDRLEGGIGADMIEGNDGNDILTDITGDDVISGGNGNDVIHGGTGLDILLGDNGADAIFHGSDDKESFGGAGNDLVMGGTGADGVSGGPGTDWIEGGTGGDTLTGDERAPFALITGEDDVTIGGAGDDVYLNEGGMDITMAGDGIDTIRGGLGFDFVSYARAQTGVFGDLTIAAVVGGGLANPRDRFALVEGIAGSPYDDSLRGDDKFRPQGHELTQKNLDEIPGLEDLLRRAEMLAAPGTLNMFTGDDLVFGGGGSDQVEGGGGNDLIDGDASIDVHLECTLNDGTPISVTSLASVQTQLLNGQLDPGTCNIMRDLTTDSSGIDTAIYRFPMDQYAVGVLPDGRAIISHIPQNGGGGGGGGGGVHVGGGGNDEGTDVLLNVEFAQFLDGTISLAPTGGNGGGNTSPTGTVTIDNQAPVEGDVLTATADVVDPDCNDPITGLWACDATFLWQSWDGVSFDPFFGDPLWNIAGVGPTYTVQRADRGAFFRVMYQYTDLGGTFESVLSPETTTPVAAGAAAVASLTLTAPATLDSRSTTLVGTFLDAAAQPVAGVAVDFFVDGVNVGTASTDATGTATLPVVLNVATDSVITFTASATDPAAVDPLLATIVATPQTAVTAFPSASIGGTPTVTEGTTGDITPMTFTITLDRVAVVDQTIDWSATSTTATDGVDFVAATGTATVLAGTSSVDITVDVLGDTAVEADETIDVALTGSTTAAIGVTSTDVGTISDDDLPTLSLGADPVATEGPGNTVTFDLTLDQAPMKNPVTVDWTLAAGTALPGTDYLDTPSTVVFGIGQTTAQVIVTLVDDTEVEFDETFSINYGNITFAVPPATVSSTATVHDDDVAILSAVAAAPVTEGNNGARNVMSFGLSLDRPSVYDVEVAWSAGGGTATPSVDFVAPDRTAVTGTVVIPAGTTSVTVPVTVIGDTLVEPNETVPFSIVGVTNAVVDVVSVTGTIVNDDTPPTITINNVTRLEGNSGFTFETFTLTLSRPADGPVSVVATTANGTAVVGSDYSRVATTVRFAAGQRTATVRVPVVGDRVRERNETFTVRLTSPNGVTISRAIGTGTILNDD